MKKREWMILGLCIVIIVLETLILIKRPKVVEPKEDSRPDTVYVNKAFKPIPEYKLIRVPYTVWVYNKEKEVKIDSISVDSSQVTISIDKISYSFSNQFLAKYPEFSKLIQFTTGNNELKITQLNTNGLICTEAYEFKPELYNYNYTRGHLTSKPKPFFQNIHPTVEILVRPIHNLWDVNLGLNYKTSIFYYEIGLNTHYYPTFENQVIFDPYLKVGAIF